ncbi:MAG: A/G-specific adenine glycosylase [Rhizobiaceae bacterium]|nr:A/G-specific adenine glycosylase [Rhizobiaceae bacterium]
MNTPPDAKALLAWYDRHRRDLPWRVTPDMRAAGAINDPYHVWLSEVMLQQTTVAAVKAYFEKFVRLWPRVEDLAAADAEDVMKAWAGLGYYARARNLKKCAEAVARDHGGRFPETAAALRALPGIGDYTSAAIAAIAFDEPVPVMDGNVERVISRLFRVEEALPGAKPILRGHLATLAPVDRPGDFAQATMDLGATICTPKRPACALCPWRGACRALAEGDPELYPVKADRKAKPVRLGGAYVAIDRRGAVLLRKRPPEGLLGGMSEVPTTGWTSRRDGGAGPEHAPFAAGWKPCGTVTHVFTHFELRLSVYRADVADAGAGGAVGSPASDDGFWVPVANLDGEALPTVMKKAISAAIPTAFKTSD